MARIVVSDASVLIGLAIVDGLNWLPQLFGTVWIPESVRREILPGFNARGETEISLAIKQKVLKIWTKSTLPHTTEFPGLDEGETDCLRIAIAAGKKTSLILMDERAGRAAAKDLTIAVAGTAAIIGLAERSGLIKSAKARFATLHATHFRISKAVIKTVLESVEEHR